MDHELCRTHRAQAVRIAHRQRELPELRQRLKPGQTWIYFIALSDGSEVKIGRSDKPGQRLAHLRVMRGDELALVAAFRAPPMMEAALHAALGSSRLHGEWFRPTAEVRLTIALARSGDVDAIERFVGWRPIPQT